MSSFGLLKTNVGLTSNIKIMFGDKSDMYMDSIDSDSELSRSKFKKFKFNKDSKYDSLVPLFYDNIPSNIAFKIKYDNDVDIMYSDFKYQYDDTYIFGARNITNTGYDYDYEYFAPLYIDIENIPEQFIIFRLDGPGIINSNKSNFRDEVLNKLKCVNHYDLTQSGNIGKWIDNSFVSNLSFPQNSLYFDFRDGYFTQWCGIDYKMGGYTEISKMLSSELYYSNNFHELEKTILNGFRDNNLIYPNILNFSFMFNDNPSTKSNLRKWSINRYVGFYINKTNTYKSVTPYKSIGLKQNVIITTDNILSMDGETKNIEPFINDYRKYDKYYLEVDGIFYEIHKKISNENTLSIDKRGINNTEEYLNNKEYFEWKVISDKNLSNTPFSRINKSLVDITEDNIIYYVHNNNPIISEFEFNKNDLWIIEIDGKYHRIGGDYINNSFVNVIYTDYGFENSELHFKYYINLVDPSYTTSLSLDKPITFRVFSCEFTDIKDFDSNIIETDFSKFELDKNDDFISTDEPKLFFEDYNSGTIPNNIDEYQFADTILNIPASSEYTASGELFQIENNTLNSIWRKNSIGVKWGYKNSLSSFDYPYLLNNSTLADYSNRTVDLNTPYLSQYNRTLDYFYSLCDESMNVYDYQSLLLFKPLDEISIGFDYQRYFSSENYFDYLFDNKYYDRYNNSKLYKKYSIINNGDNIITNSTLFRGIKLSIYKVNNIDFKGDYIKSISTSPTTDFNGFKLSILASRNLYNIKRDTSDLSKLDLSNNGGITTNNISFVWDRVKEFDIDNKFYNNDVFIQDDILYVYKTNNVDGDDYSHDIDFDIDFQKYPGKFEYYDLDTVYYNPDKTYVDDDIIYNNGSYYYYSSNNGVVSRKFWSKNQDFQIGDLCTYKDIIYRKDHDTDYTLSPDMNEDWVMVDAESTFILIDILDDFNSDITSSYVIQNDILYKVIDGKLIEYYNIEANNKILYSYVNNNQYLNNNLIHYNNTIYINRNPINVESKLDNGIDVFINMKFKNILINIYCNDNTYTFSDMTSIRKDIYNNLFNKLNASNFVQSMNDISDNNGFINNIRYIILDDEVSVYDINNIQDLPYIIQCDLSPDLLQVKNISKKYEPINISDTILKPTKLNEKGILVDLEHVEYFNSNLPIGLDIKTNISNNKHFDYYHGASDETNSYIYRYSGPYEPIFKNIDLFNINRTKFDTSLNSFGLSPERIISKVNPEENVLKLKDNKDYKSIFPIYDEVGYAIIQSYIFKSTWDNSYFYTCKKNI